MYRDIDGKTPVVPVDLNWACVPVIFGDKLDYL